MKVYQGTNHDLYAAETEEVAGKLCEEHTGGPCEEGYPRELTDAELDAKQPVFDEVIGWVDGETTTIREMLVARGSTRGWLAGAAW